MKLCSVKDVRLIGSVKAWARGLRSYAWCVEGGKRRCCLLLTAAWNSLSSAMSRDSFIGRTVAEHRLNLYDLLTNESTLCRSSWDANPLHAGEQ